MVFGGMAWSASGNPGELAVHFSVTTLRKSSMVTTATPSQLASGASVDSKSREVKSVPAEVQPASFSHCASGPDT
jgi:hypothetical protein